MKAYLNSLKVDDKLRFAEERLSYTIQAAGPRYLICSKPFNPKRTVLYCIVDKERLVRGPEGVTFGFGAETREQCEEMLKRVESGETEISYRRKLPVKLSVQGVK